MLSPKRTVVSVLIVMAAGFAGANCWFTFARSTIPLGIQGVVISKEKRLEKHPGIDDVHLITLDNQKMLHVDRSVYEAIPIESSIVKQPWQTTMEVNGQLVHLSWSMDARRMPSAMLLIWAVCSATSIAAWRLSSSHD